MQNTTALCEAKLRHAYELSVVCERKYSTLIFVQWAGALGVLAVLLLLVTK